MSAADNPVLSSIYTGLKVEGGHVDVYFAHDGETFDFVTNQGEWTAYEQAQVMSALATYSTFANVTFSITDDATEAEFKLTKSASEFGSLGFMNLPDPDLGDDQGLAWFNTFFDWGGSGSGLLDPGAYTFTIFLHEFGHGLGLDHPFDATGLSTQIPAIDPNGDGLDQGVYTVMTYNDGWPENPAGEPDSAAYGWNLTPSPIDIAVLQEMYGANTTTGAGRNTYTLPGSDEPGTGYAAIWDTGGLDMIVHSGSRAATIDLRMASLKAAEGGGGFISYVDGVHGGFTIANGVTIENAIGGSGDDTLIGNTADNRLNGGAGSDAMAGGQGDDIYIVDRVGDTVSEGRGGGNDTIRTSRIDISLADQPHVENISLFGRRHLDAEGNEADNVIEGNRGDNVIFGHGGDDYLYGGLSFDVIDGGSGNDTLIGSLGPDTLTGGAGRDTFVITEDDGRATITDFTARDMLDLSAFGLEDVASVTALAETDRAGTVLQLDGARVLFVDVAASLFTEDTLIL
ncbi:hypothetical protein ATO13_06690 [Stappia sp. 22II-S9-Z10]|nr:hypothetical protein ATO13_06690 [Stappia sp. 22II-S9-Z10]